MKTTTRTVLTACAVIQATLCGLASSARGEEKPHPVIAASTPEVMQKRYNVRVLPDQMVVPAVYRLGEGETASFTVQLPFDGALAIHGYTKDMAVTANVVMTFSLAGTRTGRFPMHVHTTDGRHVEVGVLEVMPH